MIRTALLRRTPLKRKTPMRRVAFKHTGRTVLKVVSVTKAFWKKLYAAEKQIRGEVVKNRCERCGGWTARLDGHHPYGQAGKWIMLFVMFCRDCHEWAHANPTAARDEGWICDAGKVHPHEHPNVIAARLRAEILWKETL